MSCIETTHSVGQGTTLRRDVAGRVTELALQGFLAIKSSSTAAEKMADTWEKITRRYVSAISIDLRSFWIVDGLMWRSSRWPRDGKTWSLSRSSVAS